MWGGGGGARLHEPLTAVDVVPACYLYIHEVLKISDNTVVLSM